MQFIVSGYDGTDTDAPARRLAVRDAHLAGAKAMQQKGTLLYAAALLNDNNQMMGSVMIMDFPSRKDVDHWLQDEPYVTGKVWLTVDVKPCKVPDFILE